MFFGKQPARVADRRQSILALLLEAPAQERMHPRGRQRDIGIAVEYLAQDLDDGVAAEYRLSGQQLVDDDAERPDVGALIGGFALGLFGTHVRGSSHEHSDLRGVHHCEGRRVIHAGPAARALERRLGETEIQDLHHARGRDLDVGRLQVAMDDAFLVRGLDAVDDLTQDRQRVAERHRSLQCLAFDILHDQIVRSDVVEVTDVGVVQGRDRARFAGEALRELDVRDFDRDVAIEARVVGAIHLAHATFADQRRDFVRTKCVAWGECHRVTRFYYERNI